MKIEAVGWVRSCFGSKFGVPRQPGLVAAAWGEVELATEYASPEAVRGLDGFSHVWLTFGFHKNVEAGWKPTVRPPRLGGEERVGAFASRSPFRPNFLGLSVVKLDHVRITGSGGVVLEVSGLDLVDGTPVYDIKPYLPYTDALPAAATRAGFAGEAPGRKVVRVSKGAKEGFGGLSERDQELILGVLALDPRPSTAKGDGERVFGAELCGLEVKFRFLGEVCEVVSVERILTAS